MYPFFPENNKANVEQFTDYQNENKKEGFKQNEKLMLKLTDKADYVRLVLVRRLIWRCFA